MHRPYIYQGVLAWHISVPSKLKIPTLEEGSLRLGNKPPSLTKLQKHISTRPVPFPSLEKQEGLPGREDSLTCFVSCKHFLVFLSHPRTGVGFLEMELQNHPSSCSATSLPYSCNLNKFSGFTGPESDGIVYSICCQCPSWAEYTSLITPPQQRTAGSSGRPAACTSGTH